MVCPIKKIDSNITGLAYAEEVCLGQLPTVADDGFGPTWYGLEPNSYNDFGGETTSTARAPIDPTRQNAKGVVTDLDASGGFNHDYVNDWNFKRLLQGFFFADLREKPTTKSVNAAINDATAAVAASDQYQFGAAVPAAFNVAGLLVYAANWTNVANNGVKRVTSAAGNNITVGDGIVDEPAPPADAYVKAVGYEFAAADAGITRTGNVVQLTSAANVLAGLGLIPGEWIFVGGDTLASNRFANNVGFGRIRTITAGAITFDDVTWDAATETSTGKTIRIWFGDVLKNENTRALIKRRSYQLERTLGEGENGTQAEYLEGSVANELTLNIPQAEKITADLSFVSTDNTHRSGDVDDEIKSEDAEATYVPSIGADAHNTTSNVYRLKMNILDPTNSAPTALFGYVTEGTLNINNGVTPNKAIGVLGAFDTSAANFVVSGSLTAYFQTIAAVRAVRNNADVNFNMILTAENSGFIYDIPLLALGGGRLNVEKDQPIMVPLEKQAAKNALGYTLLHNWFHYLPDVAMSQAA